MGNKFKKIRLALCLNQSEFAKALAITASSVSCYESGKRQPGFATIRKVLALAKKHHLNIKLEDLRS